MNTQRINETFVRHFNETIEVKGLTINAVQGSYYRLIYKGRIAGSFYIRDYDKACQFSCMTGDDFKGYRLNSYGCFERLFVSVSHMMHGIKDFVFDTRVRDGNEEAMLIAINSEDENDFFPDAEPFLDEDRKAA